MKRWLITTVVIVSAVLLLGGIAAAGTPADVQYGNPIEEEKPPVTPPVETKPPAPPEEIGEIGGVEKEEEEPTLVESVSESLPFTGFEAGLVLLGGAAIAATGFALRRFSRQQNR